MMPAIFFGHGNPMNAIEQNAYTEAWARIGMTIPKPKAIVMVSAHWYLPATLVTAMEKPRTIHDFGGFPRALYEVSYPAPGDPVLARRLRGFAALIEDLALRDVTARLSRFIATEARRAGRDVVDLPGTRDDVAARLGTVRELVSRSLAQLRSDGIISVQGRRIRIIDERRLRARAVT